MTPSHFFTNPYELVSYPAPWDIHILRDWITHYLMSASSSPEVATIMRAKPEEFEMIPVPRVLINRIAEGHVGSIGSASYAFNSAILNTQNIQQSPMFSRSLETTATGLLKLRKYPVLAQTFQMFIKAVEDNDEKALKNVIADDYLDESGRNKNELLKDIVGLAKKSAMRRFVPVSAEELHVVGNTFAAVVTGAWQTTGNEREMANAAFFRIEVIFVGDDKGNTRIASLSTK